MWYCRACVAVDGCREAGKPTQQRSSRSARKEIMVAADGCIFFVCLAIPTTTKTRMQHWLGSSASVPFPTPHRASSLLPPSPAGPPPSPKVLQSCAGACPLRKHARNMAPPIPRGRPGPQVRRVCVVGSGCKGGVWVFL